MEKVSCFTDFVSSLGTSTLPDLLLEWQSLEVISFCDKWQFVCYAALSD